MLKTFLETPLDFLRVIDTYPLDKQELLLSRIANVAVGMPDEERLSFEDIIYSADETTPGISLLETYYSEALEATPPQNSVSMLSWNGESFGTSEKVSKAAREKVDSDILISTIMSTVINPLFGFIGHLLML